MILRTRALTLGLVACSTLLAASCAPTGEGVGEGPGHRAQELALSPEQEHDLGEKAYAQVLSRARVYPHDSPEARRVIEVGRRLVEAVEIDPLRREINLHIEGFRFDWEFHVVESKQVNAFCLPGGKVAVYSRLLQVARTDDELAAVMGHEIAHALAHHASERVAQSQGQEITPGILSPGAALRSRAYARRQESEADHIGVFLMTFAGYDPEGAVTFWETMRRLSADRGEPFEILSDHPSDARRLAQIQAWVPQARAAKRAFDEGRVARP
jgi:predicted Zn-dependent protease